MKKLIWNTFKHSPSVFSVALLMAGSAIAAETPLQNLGNDEGSVNQNLAQGGFEIAQVFDSRPMPMDDPSLAPVGVSDLEDGEYMDQVTSVTQLSDVQPTDWAFQALQSLVERYGCIAGYPDGTYKGNRAMTRFEFAAGLNACLDRITELIAAATSDLVTREDLAVLQRLQEEFAAELAALRGRVDSLEARTAELEANQFSTTTKLNGEVLFWLSDTWGERAGGRGTPRSEDDRTETTFGYRVRLNFDTSFTGEDRLRVRLQANNNANFSGRDLTNTFMTRLGVDSSGSDNIIINKMTYRFPLLDRKGRIEVAAQGFGIDNFITPISPFESSGGGSISRFGRFNPIFYRAPSDAGFKFDYAFSDAIKLTVGYAAEDSEDPREGKGLFNGAFSAFGQFTIEPSENLAFQVGYLRAFHPENDVNLTGSTGSFNARDPFDGRRTTSDTINFEAQWKITDGFQIGGWAGTLFARPEDTDNDEDDITILTGALILSFPDLLKEGSLGGIIVGVPPIVTDGGDDDSRKDDDTSIHIEVLYRFQMNDNIAITPGLFVITNPNHIEDNDTLWVGTLRTQFRF